MKEYKNKTVIDLFTDSVLRHPNKVAIYFEETSYTFLELDRYTNKIANFFQDVGIAQGDTVAIFMTNSSHYVAITLGLGKLGAKSSFINFNLRGHALQHSIKICNPSAIVYDVGLGDALQDTQEELDEHLHSMSFCVGGDPVMFTSRPFDSMVTGMPESPLPPLTGTSSDGTVTVQ